MINELLLRTNIVDLIGTKIYLKKQGKNFWACCPFHSEQHPSFTVSLEKQFYYCFSCGSHGNVIDFLMNYDQLTFIESITELCNMNNITIENKTSINNNFLKKKLYQLMNNICVYYQNNLIQTKYLNAHKYLQNRGLNTEMINTFNIGFSLPGWNHIIKKFGITSEEKKLLDQSGMTITNKTFTYDRFRERLMFPIRDISGKIIAFGGRIIKNTKKIPKYLNSPDTTIFKKNQHLYGLYETNKKHKNLPHILLVEGYLDVIALTQFGINYSVASLGTSITSHHIRSLYKITNQIICCYDGDHAGKKAAWKTLNIVLPYLTDNHYINFVFLPYGEDPDSLIRKIGKKNFLDILTQKQDISYFLFNTLCKKIKLHTLKGRLTLTNLILPILNKIPSKTLQLFLRQQLSNKIGILDDNKLNQLIIKKPTSHYFTNKNNHSYNMMYVLIGLLIQKPTLAQLIPLLQGLEQFKNKNITIFIKLAKTCKKHPTLTTTQLLEYYREDDFFSKLKTLAYWKHMISDNFIEITFTDILIKLYSLIIEQRQEKLIAKNRIIGLKKEERQELWKINQSLSKN